MRSWDEKGKRNGALKRTNTWLRGHSPHQEVLMPAKPVQKAEEEDTQVPWGSEGIGQMKDTGEQAGLFRRHGLLQDWRKAQKQRMT